MPTIPAKETFAPEHTFVIRNPLSGRRRSRRRSAQVRAALAHAGYAIADTTAPGQATDLAREAVAAGKSAVVVLGGDGTLLETIAELPPSIALAQFPTGTVNLLAHAAGIPRIPEQWLNLLAAGTLRKVYFARINDRPFTSVASIGLDAQAVHEVNPRLKRALQEGAYGWAAFKAYWRHHPAAWELTIDGKPCAPALLELLLGTQPFFGGPVINLPGASLTDPTLTVALLYGRRRRRLWRYVGEMLIGRLPRNPHVRYLQAQQLEVRTQPPMHVEVDGEPMGMTPAVFKMEPQPRGLLAPVDAGDRSP